MSIVKRRYFAGFMGSQTRWLNKMADNGYRLVETGKLKYVFEKCESGKYIYTVEYVGDRSLEEEEKYKSFLEDLGYRVFYKNMHLDYSLNKLVIRPWAGKGGRISTTRSTYNKELLIVEKENDGRPFELHTEKEDRIKYYRGMIKPYYYAFVFALILAFVFWPDRIKTAICGGLALLVTIPAAIIGFRILKLKKEKTVEE